MERHLQDGLRAPAEPYSFVDWFVRWLWHGIVVPTFLWIRGPGLTFLCVAGVVLVAFVVGLGGMNNAFSDGAWSGLGWFITCAGILLYLRQQNQKVQEPQQGGE